MPQGQRLPTPDRRLDLDLDRVRAFAVDTAQEAGKLLRPAGTTDVTILPKGTRGDVVTSLDIAAEDYILERIRTEFPDHAIYSEEAGEVAGNGPWLWLTDPLDGTNNLAVGLSMYVVGVTLCRDGQPVLGVIHDPIADRTWSALLGGGMKGYRHHRGTGAEGGLVLAWTQGYEVGAADSTATAFKLLLEQHAQRLLQLWTPLLSWAMLARGDIDGFVGYRAGALDLHAGALIAAESGLAVVGFDGRPFNHALAGYHTPRNFVAGRPDVVHHILTLSDRIPHARTVLDHLWTGRPHLSADDLR